MVQPVHYISRKSVWSFRSELAHINYLYLLTQPIYRYLTDLQLKLNNEDMSPRGIWRFFKAKKISDNIGAFQQQVQAVKEDFLVGGLLSSI